MVEENGNQLIIVLLIVLSVVFWVQARGVGARTLFRQEQLSDRVSNEIEMNHQIKRRTKEERINGYCLA